MASIVNRGAAAKLCCALAMIVWPLVYRNDYLLNVMVLAGIYAVMSVGYTILSGQARQLSLGHAAFFGIGAYCSALLTIDLGAPPLLALIVGAVAAGAVAWLMGKQVLRLRGFILALVTLGLGQIFYIIVREARGLTGGLIGVLGIPWLSVGGFALDDFLRQYYAVWAVVLVVVIFSERALRSRPGRAMRALAVNEPTAATLGINTSEWKLTAFVVSAVYAGLAGGLFAFFISVINPDDFGFALSFLVMIMVVLGGMGSMLGAVGGAVLLAWLVRSFSSYQNYSGLLYALALIAFVIFLPGGLAGGLRQDQKDWLRQFLKVPSRWRLARGGQPTSGGGELSPLSPQVVAPPTSYLAERKPAGDLTAEGSHRESFQDREPLLRMEGVSVSFGGVHAVDEVTLSVPRGVIAALIGPNGAGKTTLFNTISGLQRLEGGRVWFDGQEITRHPAVKIARLGMARTFQSVRLFGNMSVLDNVMVGRHRHEKASFVMAGLGLRWQLGEERVSRQRSLEALALVGLEDRADWPVSSLPYGQQRMVEIARALATEPQLLLLDEPASGLNTSERMQLMERVARIRDKGITVLLVEHDMELVMGISDVVSVLNYGRLIAQGKPEEVQEDREVIEAYLGVGSQGLQDAGERPADTSLEEAAHDGKALLEIKGVSTYYGSVCALREVSLRVHPGEIVAVLGANGAGKTTLLHTISGVLRPRRGRIAYESREITRLSPHEIAGHGIGHVLEGRHIFPTLTVEDNLRMGAYRRREQSEIAENREFVYALFPVLAERRRQAAGTLSGGQQQMLAIGRAVMGRPRLLLLDEPSMGLAPLVVEHIFQTLVALNQHGLTLLMVEQNAEIALSVAHRAIVLQTGKVVLSGAGAELRRDDRVRGLYLGRTQTVAEA